MRVAPTRLIVAIAAIAAAGWGCGTAPRSAAPQAPAADAATALAARFAAGRALLEGFDPAEPEGRWRPGDRVLLGIAADGAGPPREWYMRVTAVADTIELSSGEKLTARDRVKVSRTEDPDGPRLVVDFELVLMSVELFDGEGKSISASTAMMPSICLQHGLTEFIEQERAGLSIMRTGEPQERTPEGELKATELQRRNLAGWLAIMKLPEFLNRNKSMEGLVWQLIERPGVLSVVVNGGVSMSLQMRGKDATPVEAAAGMASPVYDVPMQVLINDRTAMECQLRVAPAAPPLGPCNGLVAIDARNPRDPGKRVSVRLLAARRGVAQPPAEK